MLHDGWLLRFTPGKSRNPNSVWPLYDVGGQLERNIAFCEREYESRALSCSFRLRQGDDHREIRTALEARGYVPHNPNPVLTLDSLPASDTVIRDVTLDEWLDTIQRIDPEMDLLTAETKRGPLSRVSLPTWYGLVELEGEPVSYGRAVRQDNLIQLAELWTTPERRNQGLGTRLINGLIRFGKETGARTAFLPVAESNPGARRLYERIGFKQVYGYTYMIQPA